MPPLDPIESNKTYAELADELNVDFIALKEKTEKNLARVELAISDLKKDYHKKLDELQGKQRQCLSILRFCSKAKKGHTYIRRERKVKDDDTKKRVPASPFDKAD